MSVTSNCGSISGLRKRLSLGPVILMALLTAALILHDTPVVIESLYLLPFLNFFFRTVISCVVAGLAAMVYLRRGMYSALFLGSGMLIYGVSSLFAGTMSVLGRANLSLTLHNLSLLISAFLFLYSTIRIQQGESPSTPPVSHHRCLLICYGGSILLPVLLMGPILGGMLPVFFIQGQGPTMTRQLVLILAIVMLGSSSTAIILRHLRTRQPFAWWFGLGLIMLLIGTTGIFFEHAIGDPVSWSGRISTYLSGIYLLIAIRSLNRQARCLGISLESAMTEFFVDTDARYRLLVENLPDIIAHHDLESRIIYINPAVERLTGLPPSFFIGKKFSEFGFDEENQAKVLAAMERTLREGREQSVFFESVTTSGRKYFNTIFIPTRDSSGRITGFLDIGRDITSDLDNQRRLAESEERYRTLAETSFDAILITVPDDGILYANPAAQRMLGMSAEEVCKARREDLVDTSDPRLQILLEERARTGTASGEMRLRRKDGALFPSFIASTLFTDSRGKVKSSVIFRDISEQKRYEAELQAARAEAERRAAEAESANQAKTQFLRHMSHELRTPINGIMGMTHLAILETGKQKVQEYLGYASKSAEHLLNVVNNVLDLSKIEAGKVELRQDNFELQEFLDSILQPFRLQAEQQDLAFRQDLDNLPQRVQGDPGRLRQVLINLLGNAIKFTRTGKIVVTVRARERTSSAVNFHFSVRDTGIGIAAERLERIFESFGQLGDSQYAGFGGTGLGLAISRQLVELMGGRIWAESSEGKGSIFHFSLPLKISSTAETVTRAPETPAGKPGRPGLSILVAEDEVISQLLMQNLLQRMGHEVATVSNGREALDKLALEKFDLVLMDVSMPVMNGEEAIKAIRSGKMQGVDPHVKVVALTAYALRDDRDRFLESGFDDYLSKPINMSKLQEQLENLQTRNDLEPVA